MLTFNIDGKDSEVEGVLPISIWAGSWHWSIAAIVQRAIAAMGAGDAKIRYSGGALYGARLREAMTLVQGHVAIEVMP